MKRTCLSIALATLLLTSQGNAFSILGTSVDEATLPAQLTQLIEEAANAVSDYKSMEVMYTNLKGLSERDFLEFEDQFDKILQIADYTGSLAYAKADFEEKFKEKFKDYDKFVEIASSATKIKDFQAIYKDLGETTRNTVNASLKQLNTSLEELRKDDGSLASLQEASKGISSDSNGQKQALQIGHQIAIKTQETLKKLQQVMMTNTQVQSSWIAKQNAKEEIIDANSALRVHGEILDSTKYKYKY